MMKMSSNIFLYQEIQHLCTTFGLIWIYYMNSIYAELMPLVFKLVFSFTH